MESLSCSHGCIKIKRHSRAGHWFLSFFQIVRLFHQYFHFFLMWVMDVDKWSGQRGQWLHFISLCVFVSGSDTHRRKKQCTLFSMLLCVSVHRPASALPEYNEAAAQLTCPSASKRSTTDEKTFCLHTCTDSCTRKPFLPYTTLVFPDILTVFTVFRYSGVVAFAAVFFPSFSLFSSYDWNWAKVSRNLIALWKLFSYSWYVWAVHRFNQLVSSPIPN